MSLEHKDATIKLLRDFVDCFTWNYREMPGPSQELVEHWLCMVLGLTNILLEGLIRLFMIGLRKRWNDYSMQGSFDLADMRSGFSSSYQNTSKIQVCIDFRNLNKVTPKDEYYMPIADMLINNASGHQVISF
jgi:hypothetical protein